MSRRRLWCLTERQEDQSSRAVAPKNHRAIPSASGSFGLATHAVRYGFEIAGIDVAEGAKPAVRLLSGEALRCRAVIGADGVRSKVAAALGLGPANFAGMTAHRGMATFPRGEMEKVLPRSRIRMVWGEGKR